MNRSQATVCIALALLIGYGAGYFAYLIRFPHRAEIERRAHTPEQSYSPLLPAIERARRLHTAGKLQEAQKLLREQLRLHPQAENAQSARDLLGSFNTELFFSDKSLYGKTEYIVARGDSLARIARKLNSTPDMIMHANDLNSTLIHPGDRLLVPDGEFTVTIDLPKERVVVHHGDGFFKQYPIQTVDLPASSQPRIATKVNAIVFWKDGERITPTAAEKDDVTPWIHLTRSGYILYGVSEPNAVEGDGVEISEEQARSDSDQSPSSAASPNPDVPPHGIALLKDDLLELQQLLRRGTPVTIIRDRN